MRNVHSAAGRTILEFGSRLALWLALLLVPALCAAKTEAPVTTSLELQSMPAGGGRAVVNMIMTPQITPLASEVIFSLARQDGEPVVVATRPATLQDGTQTQASATIDIPAAGIYTIYATVNMTVQGGRYSQVKMLRLNVPKAGPATLEKEQILSARQIDERAPKVPPKGARPAPLRSNTAAFTVSGILNYTDKPFSATAYTGTAPAPLRRVKVEIRDKNGASFQSLGTVMTDDHGAFSVNVSNNIDGDGTGRDIYVSAIADTAVARVQDLAGNAYYYDTAVQDNWAGGNLNLGTITIPLVSSGPWNIYDSILRGYDFAQQQGSTPPKVNVNWAVGNEDGTHFHSSGASGKKIDLLGLSSDPDEFDDAVICHEYGHFLGDAFSYDKSPGGSHSWAVANTRPGGFALAWSEGWAAFLSAAALNNRYYFDYNTSGGNSTDIELPTGSPRGDNVEASVAGCLWDVYDSANDGADTLTDSAAGAKIWKIFQENFNNVVECSLLDFYNAWVALAYPNLDKLKAILAERGINYWTLATLSLNGPAVSGNVAAPGAYEIYKLAVPSTNYYLIQTYPGGLADTILNLAPSPTAITPSLDNDDIYYSRSYSVSTSQIAGKITPGTYYVRVCSYGSKTGSYTVKAFSMNPQTIPVNGSAANGNVTSKDDVDWFKFTAAVDGSYTIETTAGTLTDTLMYLFMDPNMSYENDADVIDYNDDIDYDNDNYMSRITQSLVAGTYFVRVRGFEADTGNYAISVTRPTEAGRSWALYE